MNKIDSSNWKEFSLKSLGFAIYHGKRIKKAERVDGDIVFLTAGKENCGVVGTIGNDVKLWNCPITVDMFGNSFYHNYECSGDDNVYAFINNDLSGFVKMFIASAINAKTRMLYSYIDQFRQKDAEALSVKLPTMLNGLPDFKYMENYMKALEDVVNSSLTNLQSAEKVDVSKTIDTSNWKNFKIEDLFIKLELKTLKKNFNKTFDVSETQDNEFSLPLVNAKHFNNGIMYYGRECDFEASEMTIDIVKNGAIATGDVYAQPQKTGVLWDAYLIKPKAEVKSELVLFFLATTLEKAIKDKFSYDDKCIWPKVKKLSIPLPITEQNTPDYDYMEKYMCAILGKSKNSLDALLKSC